MGSFKKLPVSIIVFVYVFLLLIHIFTLQYILLLSNFPFIVLNTYVIKINPKIPPAITIFIGYVPISTPLFH